FYNSAGNQIKSRDATFVAPSHRGKLLSGANLIEIAQIDDSDRPDYLKELQIEVACDVENPLFGERGATRIYGPQKGANAKMIEELERGVISFAYRCREWSGRDLSMVKGAGAAGGIGYALALFLNAKLRSGWRLLFDIANVENRIREADLIITGEGRVDRQSLYGKLLEGVLQLATKYRKRVWVVCGENRLSTQELKSAGVEQLFSISQIEPNKNMAIASAKRFLTIKAQEAAKLLEVELSSKVGL
ncbi:MAG: glycerate kinase, partial [Bacteroidales bacterium]